MIGHRAKSVSSVFVHGTLVMLLGLALSACGGGDGGDGGDVGGEGEPEAGSVSGQVTGDLIVIDRDVMPDLPCHAMDNTIMGECSEDDVDGLLDEMGVDRSEIVIHDKDTMSEEECHVMERSVMGNCTDAEVDQFAEEIRSRQ